MSHMSRAVGSVQIMVGDSAEVLKTIAAGSIDLTVTSPPYDGLRTYNGYSFDFETIAAELFRVTKDGGVVVWVVGDATVKGSETGTSFRQALHFKDIGFNLHDTMIYRKKSTSMAGSLKAYMGCFEYMFVFAKGDIKTVNILMDRPNQEAGKIKNRARRTADGAHKAPEPKVVQPFGRRYNIWEYGKTTGWKEACQHPAIFPEQLATDHIASWSNPGDTVLDPFFGSGTTGKMAQRLGRNCIGIEVSREYAAIAEARIAADSDAMLAELLS